MGRHAPGRGGRAALVSTLAVALAAGSITLFSGTEDSSAAPAAGTGTTEIVLDDPSSTTPRADRLLSAGATGFLHRQSGVTGLLWTDYDEGTTVTVKSASGSAYTPKDATCYHISDVCPSGRYGQGTDTVTLPTQYDEDLSLWTADGGVSDTFTIWPDDYIGTYGDTVVLADDDAVIDYTTVEGTTPRLVDHVGGERRERWVTGYPSAEAEWASGMFTRTGDKDGALLAYPVYVDGDVASYTVGYLDFATAHFTVAFTGADAQPQLVLSADKVGWYTEASGLHLKPRGDLTAAETTPVPGEDTAGTPAPVLVGDWLVLATDGGAVRAVSLADGTTTKTLLTWSYGTPPGRPRRDRAGHRRHRRGRLVGPAGRPRRGRHPGARQGLQGGAAGEPQARPGTQPGQPARGRGQPEQHLRHHLDPHPHHQRQHRADRLRGHRRRLDQPRVPVREHHLLPAVGQQRQRPRGRLPQHVLRR
ncbi:hypothetical protein ABZ848_07960 [Streptomyces sp. NPDC047081]|uniref:hypothetical protein n=1 Tax=Streptomyces sp. NPDC047081 TaxID=3154706 RepID=UPI0033E25EB5